MEKKNYWTSQRKTQVVLRLLRGEDMEILSREHEVTVSELTQWREVFLTHGEMGFKRDPERSKLDKAQRIIGQLQMEIELIKKKNALIRKQNGL